MYYCAPRERGREGRERDRVSLCAAYIRDRRHLCSPSNTTSFYEMFSLHSFPSVQGVVCIEHNIIEMRNCLHTACSNLPHNPHTCNTHTRERASLFFRFFPLLFIHNRQSLTRSSRYASASHLPSSVASRLTSLAGHATVAITTIDDDTRSSTSVLRTNYSPQHTLA